jgi:transposase
VQTQSNLVKEDSVSFNRIFQRLLGLAEAVVEHVDFDGDDLVVHARPKAGRRGRCGKCGKRRPGYDLGVGRRRWRGLDLGTVKTWIEAASPRVDCPTCGVTVAAVPWARHRAGFTRDPENLIALLLLNLGGDRPALPGRNP